MVEYGHGVGEVSGRVGGGQATGGGDLGAQAANFVSNAVNQFSALPPEGMFLVAVLVLAGLLVLKRAF
jgi:hypothetical protein